MLKGKRWIAFLTIVVFTAALSYFAREKNGAARQEAWASHTLADAGYEDEAPADPERHLAARIPLSQ